MELKSILISRTDSIGDVVLTLPLAYILKQNYPNAVIGFLGKKYTQPVIETCTYVDQFIDLDDFMQNEVTIKGQKIDCIIHVLPKSAIAKRAKSLKIPIRIGTKNRLYHWWTCNKLIKLSRKNSDLHESQLNIQLLSSLVKKVDYSLSEIGQMPIMTRIQNLDSNFSHLLASDKKNIILHPKSQGSAREWPLQEYIQLIQNLDPTKFKIFISGTEKERAQLDTLFEAVGNLVTDICGKMPLGQFIAFIQKADTLVACSTGPLHIAASVGTHAIGIYIPIRPVHPGRWQPIGKNIDIVCADLLPEKSNLETDANYYLYEIENKTVQLLVEKN